MSPFRRKCRAILDCATSYSSTSAYTGLQAAARLRFISPMRACRSSASSWPSLRKPPRMVRSKRHRPWGWRSSPHTIASDAWLIPSIRSSTDRSSTVGVISRPWKCLICSSATSAPFSAGCNSTGATTVTEMATNAWRTEAVAAVYS